MSRKSFIIVMTAILAVLIIGGYFLLERPAEPGERRLFGNLPIIGGRPPLTPPPTPPPTSPVGAGAGKAARLRQVIARDVIAPSVGPDNRSLYYVERTSGRIMKSDLDGNGEEAVTAITVPEVFEGLWSPSKTKIALAYHEAGTVKRFIEATATGTPSRFLPSGVTSVGWSPDGKRMAYLLPQGDQVNVVTAGENGTGARTVFSTPVPDFTLAWLTNASILLTSRPSGLAPSLVLRLDTATGRAEPLLVGTAGVVTLALPDGRFVFSRSSPDGSAETIQLRSVRDGKIGDLGLVTVAEKCALGPRAKRLICGAPTGVIRPPSPDEWYRGALSFTDEIVEINLDSGERKVLASEEADVDVVDPLVTPDERYLFFRDKKTGTLWRLELTASQ